MKNIGEAKTKGKVRVLLIEESSEGQRLDNFLFKMLRGVPKSKIYRIIRRGEVRVNKGRCKPESRLTCGDSVRVPPLLSVNKVNPPGAIPTRLLALLQEAVIYEDDGLLIVNKPQGIAVHGGSGLSYGVIEILRELRSDLRYLELVHRLDKETSGVLMIAKKRKKLVELHDMLRSGRVHKTYQAWVHGKWSARKPAVTVPLRKNIVKSGERMVVVAADGKPSETLFERLCYAHASAGSPDNGWAEGCSLIKATPVTGRTHQIRVHCQFAGHPILGDTKYCPSEINRKYHALGVNRMCLHAYSLALDWPGQKTQDISAPWALEKSPLG